MSSKYEYQSYVPGQSIRGISSKTIEEYKTEIEKCKKRGTDTAALEHLLDQILAIYKEIEEQIEKNKQQQKKRGFTRSFPIPSRERLRFPIFCFMNVCVCVCVFRLPLHRYPCPVNVCVCAP